MTDTIRIGTVTVPRLLVRTRAVAGDIDLVDALPSADGVGIWVRGRDGIVGWGEAAHASPTGPDRFAAAQDWWQAVCTAAEVDDEVALPGTGLLAFASFAFADRPGDSRLIVPATVLGRVGGQCWRTTVSVADGPPPGHGAPEYEDVRAPGPVRFIDGDVPAERFEAVVAAGVRRIASGAVQKIVLARDDVAATERPVDPRYLAARLAATNPSSWTFCVGGLVGATPELLLRRRGGLVQSRVLAGTSFPGAPGEWDLSGRAKDRAEHRFAVRSVLDSLAPYTSELCAPPEPAVLRLGTLAHLATDVHGRLHPHAPDTFAVLAALHPSAAVGGTPRPAALREIAALEPMRRGRYAGPVGWIDARGDGEFGIALRCGQIEGARLRMYAGCGIVATSDPATESAEAAAKLGVLRSALTGRTADWTGTDGRNGARR